MSSEDEKDKPIPETKTSSYMRGKRLIKKEIGKGEFHEIEETTRQHGTYKRQHSPLEKTARQEAFLMTYRRGFAISHCCEMLGINHSTLEYWRKTDRTFSDAFLQATREVINLHLKIVEEASLSGDWRASAWLLSHLPRTKNYFVDEKPMPTMQITQVQVNVGEQTKAVVNILEQLRQENPALPLSKEKEGEDEEN